MSGSIPDREANPWVKPEPRPLRPRVYRGRLVMAGEVREVTIRCDGRGVDMLCRDAMQAAHGTRHLTEVSRVNL